MIIIVMFVTQFVQWRSADRALLELHAIMEKTQEVQNEIESRQEFRKQVLTERQKWMSCVEERLDSLGLPCPSDLDWELIQMME